MQSNENNNWCIAQSMLFYVGLVTVSLVIQWWRQSTCSRCSPFRSRHRTARLRADSNAARYISADCTGYSFFELL